MTAPDQPEPICGPSCTPDCGMGHCYLTDGTYIDPEHAHKLNNQANEHAANELLTTPKLAADDLRDRIAIVLAYPELVDAVMTEVQPVLDQQAAEIRKWQLAYNGANAMARVGKVHLKRLWETRDQLKAAEQRAEEAEERADQAEEIAGIARDTSNRSEAERARAVQRAEAAERELAALRTHQQIGDQP